MIHSFTSLSYLEEIIHGFCIISLKAIAVVVFISVTLKHVGALVGKYIFNTSNSLLLELGRLKFIFHL